MPKIILLLTCGVSGLGAKPVRPDAPKSWVVEPAVPNDFGVLPNNNPAESTSSPVKPMPPEPPEPPEPAATAAVVGPDFSSGTHAAAGSGASGVETAGPAPGAGASLGSIAFAPAAAAASGGSACANPVGLTAGILPGGVCCHSGDGGTGCALAWATALGVAGCHAVL